MATINRKKKQSFGLSAIEPFIKNGNYAGYGDVSGLYVKDSGYSFLYGITYQAKSDVLNPTGTPESVPESETVHISFGDRFNESIVVYCLIPENEPSLNDVLLVILDDTSFQRFAFPTNSTIPEAPASPGAWGVVKLVEFMACNADMNQETALEVSEFKRVGMLILEHLKSFKLKSESVHHADYDHVFYPRGRKHVSDPEDSTEVNNNLEEGEEEEEEAAEGATTNELGSTSQPKQKARGSNKKKEISLLLAEAAAAYDLAAPTPRKRGTSVRFDRHDFDRVDSEADSKSRHDTSVNVDRSIIVDKKSMTPSHSDSTSSKKTRTTGKMAKTPEQKEAEAQVKEYRKQLQDSEKTAKQIENELKALKAKVAADASAAERAPVKKDNSTTAAAPQARALNTNNQATDSRETLRSHADADLVYEAKRDEHVFTLLERANTLVQANFESMMNHVRSTPSSAPPDKPDQSSEDRNRNSKKHRKKHHKKHHKKHRKKHRKEGKRETRNRSSSSSESSSNSESDTESDSDGGTPIKLSPSQRAFLQQLLLGSSR